MQIIDGIPVFGQHDDNTLIQIKTCLDAGGSAAALMADGHLGYAQPIGGVVAYENRVSISGVGYDIACGNMAIRTDVPGSMVRPVINKLMDRVAAEVSFGIGRTSGQKAWAEHALFDDPAWALESIAHLKDMARCQLGTVGSGNHYVDIFVDERDMTWVGVHFGSRGFGHKTATAYLKAAGGIDGLMVAPTLVEIGTSLGDDYLAAMTLAGRYAYAGREFVARHVAQNIVGGKIEEEIHNHHNFAWKECHPHWETGVPTDYYVVRKGATPAGPGVKGFIGGSMGDNAVIVEGVESRNAMLSLYSTIHGAGRVMSRTQARGKINRKTGVKKTEGQISRAQMDTWLQEQGVTLRGGDTDESPQAYRRLPNVLAAHEGTIKVLHTLKPIGVVMAGSDVFDPFQD